VIDTLYQIIETLLPFEWLQYNFMKNAFIALLLAAPLFGALGSMVVSNKMAFFSDALGHGAFTGIAIGALSGLIVKPMLAAVLFSIVFAIVITLVKRRSRSSSDTVIGVFTSTAAAIGIALLSVNGGIARYSNALTGDILSVAPQQLGYLAIVFLIIAVVWCFCFNAFFLTWIDSSLARSRGMHTMTLELVFTIMLAALVSISITWIGLLLINSFLVLPAATARLMARNLRQYHLLAIVIAVVCSFTGLGLSYLLGIATGAAIVILCALCYFIALIIRGMAFKPHGNL
jgi:zinc transport system permease protein